MSEHGQHYLALYKGAESPKSECPNVRSSACYAPSYIVRKNLRLSLFTCLPFDKIHCPSQFGTILFGSFFGWLILVQATSIPCSIINSRHLVSCVKHGYQVYKCGKPSGGLSSRDLIAIRPNEVGRHSFCFLFVTFLSSMQATTTHSFEEILKCDFSA